MKIEDLPETMEPKHVQAILGISRRYTYEMLEKPPFHTLRVGNKIKIPKRTFLSWFLGEEKQGD